MPPRVQHGLLPCPPNRTPIPPRSGYDGGALGNVTDACNAPEGCLRTAENGGDVSDGLEAACNADDACEGAARDDGRVCGIRSACNAAAACLGAGQGAEVCPGLTGCCNAADACQGATATPAACLPSQTGAPTASQLPSHLPSAPPSSGPTGSAAPSQLPSVMPSAAPSRSEFPSDLPSVGPSASPAGSPTAAPTPAPNVPGPATYAPTGDNVSYAPTSVPDATSKPTLSAAPQAPAGDPTPAPVSVTTVELVTELTFNNLLVPEDESDLDDLVSRLEGVVEEVITDNLPPLDRRALALDAGPPPGKDGGRGLSAPAVATSTTTAEVAAFNFDALAGASVVRFDIEQSVTSSNDVDEEQLKLDVAEALDVEDTREALEKEGLPEDYGDFTLGKIETNVGGGEDPIVVTAVRAHVCCIPARRRSSS